MEISKTDAALLWSLMPNWVKDQPIGLDPSFYGTGSKEGDELVKSTVKRILFGESHNIKEPHDK